MPIATPKPLTQNTSNLQRQMPLSDPSPGHQLSDLMFQYGVDDTTDVDISELLKTLDVAEGMTTDVDGKLDDILKNLDTLLESMEGGQHGFVTRPTPPKPDVVKM